jgi:antitoxin CcdA
LTEVRAPGFNQLQAACEPQLRESVCKERRWNVEHADFVIAYNATVEQEGFPLEQWKPF